jgi:hypothetical protein
MTKIKAIFAMNLVTPKAEAQKAGVRRTLSVEAGLLLSSSFRFHQFVKYQIIFLSHYVVLLKSDLDGKPL